MKRSKMLNTVLMGTIGLALSVPPAAAQEIELTNVTPTVKSVAVKIEGTKREEVALDTLNGMVQDILKNARLGVARLPAPDAYSYSTTPTTKAAERLEIVIGATSPARTGQPYKVSITLQEAGTTGTPDFFNYRPENPDQIYQDLKNYLTKRLNLRPRRPSYSSRPVVETEPQPVSPPSVFSRQPFNEPRGFQKDPQPVSVPYQEEPENVYSQGEVQLRNMTPAVKKISVSSEGTEREQKVLDTVYHMVVNDILKNAKPGMVRIPVSGDPMATPAIKVYENLEIVIGAKSPARTGQPYKVSITLQEKGTQGEPRYFNYRPRDWWYFYENLQAYLTQQLNLQPK
jgi:hypothetical protein